MYLKNIRNSKRMGEASMINNNELLELLKAGDKEAFGNLYDCYGSALYGEIYKRFQNSEDAGKILCAVFLEFKRNISQRDKIEEGIFICLFRIVKKLTNAGR